MKPIVVALAALAGSASTGASQAASIARRVDAVRDGVISMRFASVPNVCGDGSGSTWTQQGAKLTANDESGAAHLGWSVALSNDGNTALIGGPTDNSNMGAA